MIKDLSRGYKDAPKWPKVKSIRKKGKTFEIKSLKDLPYILRIPNLEALRKRMPSDTPEKPKISPTRSADYLFYNTVPLPNNDFYPFSKRPVTGDIFYIGDEEAFSKKCRPVNIVIHYGSGERIISTVPDDTTSKPASNTSTDRANRLIVWEYFDEKKWKKIPGLKVSPGTSEDQVTFTIPCDVGKTTVNDYESYWIRARIAFGDYGTEKYKVKKTDGGDTDPTTFEYEILYDNINAPHIWYVEVNSSGGSFTAIKQYVTYNNLSYKEIATNGRIVPFKPFELLDESKSSFYLGLDKKIQQGPISIYFDIEPDYTDYKEIPTINFYYYNGAWEKISTEDKTDGFTKSGEVKLLIPSDFIASDRFGHKLYWIKISHSNQIIIKRKINGIFLNTVISSNSETIRNESLGSSKNLPDQIFELKKIPIHESPLRVWVREPSLLDSKKRNDLLNQKKLSEVTDANHNILEQWVLWNEADEIGRSKPDDQHFESDRVLKKIQFGNNLHGKIPPDGFDSIKIDYVAGGGKDGNLAKNTITSLVGTVPFVSSVNNPLPSGGGVDKETIPHLLSRAPHSIKNRGQAITLDDYEWLVQEHFPSISRSKCLTATKMDGTKAGGHVSIVLVPFSEEKKPIPNRRLVDQVEKMLKKRSATTIKKDGLKVIPPKYIEASVTGTICCKTVSDVPVAERKALDVLERFYHPLNGGREQKGWDFGELVCLSDIYALLEEIPEVDNIEDLSIVGHFDDEEKKQVAFVIDNEKKEVQSFPPHALICSGSHRLAVKVMIEQ